MITYSNEDIFSLKNVKALVNPVNCIGVMGKGLALQFKERYKDNFTAYRKACKERTVKLGKMFIFETGLDYPQYIVNFPTKWHWKDKSVFSDIECGLIALSYWVSGNKIPSIAIPKIGCGLGGLYWEDVKPLIEKYLGDIPNLDVKVLSL